METVVVYPDAFRPAEDREIMGEKIIHTVVTPGQKPGRAQIREIGEAAERPVAPDDECPNSLKSSTKRWLPSAENAEQGIQKSLISRLSDSG